MQENRINGVASRSRSENLYCQLHKGIISLYQRLLDWLL